jgi:hypothetical protein
MSTRPQTGVCETLRLTVMRGSGSARERVESIRELYFLTRSDRDAAALAGLDWRGIRAQAMWQCFAHVDWQ